MERLDRNVDYGSRIMDCYSRIMDWPYTFGPAGGTTTDTHTTDINDETRRQGGSLELDRHGSDD
jgi:hypothetical protein